MGLKITGLDDLQRHLQDLQRRAESIAGQHDVPMPELFRSEFMLLNTEFESIEDLFAASSYKIQGSEDLAAIPDDDWDVFIRSKTRFASWEEMLQAAGQEYFARRLNGEG